MAVLGGLLGDAAHASHRLRALVDATAAPTTTTTTAAAAAGSDTAATPTGQAVDKWEPVTADDPATLALLQLLLEPMEQQVRTP